MRFQSCRQGLVKWQPVGYDAVCDFAHLGCCGTSGGGVRHRSASRRPGPSPWWRTNRLANAGYTISVPASGAVSPWASPRRGRPRRRGASLERKSWSLLRGVLGVHSGLSNGRGDFTLDLHDRVEQRRRAGPRLDGRARPSKASQALLAFDGSSPLGPSGVHPPYGYAAITWRRTHRYGRPLRPWIKFQGCSMSGE